jgi:GNAT superfamily N-acetyltransferase
MSVSHRIHNYLAVLANTAEIPNLKGMTARELQHYVEANYPVKLWLDDCGHLTELSLIAVDRAQRMTGVGSKAITLLTQWADANQTVLAVTPTRGMDNARTGVARLLGFYKRFGFTENKGRKRDFSTRSTMLRLPVARKIVG